MEEIKSLNIIFLSLVEINEISDSNIYADLLRFFVRNGHHVTCFSPYDRTKKKPENILSENFEIYRFKIPKIQKANKFEKALGLFSYDLFLKRVLKKKLVKRNYDLLIYSTPPINFVNSIKYLKTKFDLRTYLLLKDIFPQNAVDLGLLRQGSILYNHFRKTEKKLYELSDTIGCMSLANVDYILKNNSYLDQTKKIEVCPNSIEYKERSSYNLKSSLRDKYGINQDVKLFIYGGNLGKPQGIDFLLQILDHFINDDTLYFIILGSGTEYNLLDEWFSKNNPSNAMLKSYVPKDEYDNYLAMSDIGLVFLNHKFTIPNYPSRILSYMEFSLPILSFTDTVTDVGSNAKKIGYGEWAESNDLKSAARLIKHYACMSVDDLRKKGLYGNEYLKNNYSVEKTSEKILQSINI